MPAAIQDLGQHRRRLPAALGHVGVRIGIVADQHVAALEQRRGKIGMDVEGRDDRACFAEHRTQPRQQLRVGIVDAFRDHGAVQRHQRAIQRQAGLSSPAGLADQMLVRLRRHDAGRHRRREQAKAQIEAVRGRGLDHAADLGVGAGEVALHRIARNQLIGFERGEIGQAHSEGVGLVPEAGDQHAAGHRRLPVESATGRPCACRLPGNDRPPPRRAGTPHRGLSGRPARAPRPRRR